MEFAGEKGKSASEFRVHCDRYPLGMGNELGNSVIDRQRDSRQRRPQSWYPRLKSFGITVIEIAEIENYALCWCLCDPGLYPDETSTLV